MGLGGGSKKNVRKMNVLTGTRRVSVLLLAVIMRKKETISIIIPLFRNMFFHFDNLFNPTITHQQRSAVPLNRSLKLPSQHCTYTHNVNLCCSFAH